MTTIVLTIVGILLAAAAALMAFWYGGDAFGSGNDRARAETVVSMMQQTAYAVQMYSAQTGEVVTARSSDGIGATLLGHGYMTQIPINPYSREPIVATNRWGGSDDTTAARLYSNMGGSDEARRICIAINAGRDATAPETLMMKGWDADVARGRHRVGCLANSYYQPALYQVYVVI